MSKPTHGLKESGLRDVRGAWIKWSDGNIICGSERQMLAQAEVFNASMTGITKESELLCVVPLPMPPERPIEHRWTDTPE